MDNDLVTPETFRLFPESLDELSNDVIEIKNRNFKTEWEKNSNNEILQTKLKMFNDMAGIIVNVIGMYERDPTNYPLLKNQDIAYGKTQLESNLQKLSSNDIKIKFNFIPPE